jgi:hypothetical protein
MLYRSFLSLALVGLSAHAFGDTVWMKNGDRLTGTIKVLDGGKLQLDTDYGGSIPLDWSKIATLESQDPLVVKQGKYDEDGTMQALQKSDPGKVALGEGRTVELASIDQVMKPKPLIKDFEWKGNVDVALDYKRADTDTDDYNVAMNTKAQHGLWRHNVDAEYNREKQDEAVTTDNYGLEYALDRFITEKWFWQGRLDYKRDKVEDLARQRTVGTGPGYQFWDDELGAFSLIGLINRSDYEYADGGKDNFYSLATKWDYNRYLYGKTVEIFTTGEFGRPLDNTADFSLDAEAGLRYKVTDWASLNMKAEKDLVSGAEGDLNETRYTIGFGVGW